MKAVSDQPRTIVLNIVDGGSMPVIRPDDFLRTRLKTGSRFYLVADAETVPQGRAKHPRVRVQCYQVTSKQWEQREHDQRTHWFRHNYKPVPNGRRRRTKDQD